MNLSSRGNREPTTDPTFAYQVNDGRRMTRAKARGLPLVTHARAVLWLCIMMLVDASGPVLLIAAVAAIFLDLWLRPLHLRAISPPFSKSVVWPDWPLEFQLFGLAMAANVLFQQAFVDAESSPYLLNIVVTHSTLLLWAYTTTPTDQRMMTAVHKWTMVFICLLSGLLFLQVLWRENFGSYLDFRFMLTGEAARSAADEFSEGTRPTTLFAEPSNHAIAIFLLAFVHDLAGRRAFWIVLVAAASCLLTNSTMGVILALYLLLDEASRHVRPARIMKRLPAILIGGTVLVGLAITLDAKDIIAFAYERIVAPESAYDPIAVRLYVPLKIADFSLYQHLFGSGIANYASFPEGLTLNDSSLLLAAYFQLGVVGLLLLWSPVRALAKHSSWGPALLLLVLYTTKLGFLMPAFWAVAMFSHNPRRLPPVLHSPRSRAHNRRSLARPAPLPPAQST